MSFTPRYLGDPRPFVNSFILNSGTPFPSFNAGDIALHFVNLDNGIATTGAGIWSGVLGNTAIYTPDPSDIILTTPGIYKFYPTVRGTPFDWQVIEILDPNQVL